jgi:hypothetical protein
MHHYWDSFCRDWCQDATNKYIDNIKGHVGMIVGSQHPWAEHMMLTAEARLIITMEYMKIKTDHPRLKVYQINIDASFN